MHRRANTLRLKILTSDYQLSSLPGHGLGLGAAVLPTGGSVPGSQDGILNMGPRHNSPQHVLLPAGARKLEQPGDPSCFCQRASQAPGRLCTAFLLLSLHATTPDSHPSSSWRPHPQGPPSALAGCCPLGQSRPGPTQNASSLKMPWKPDLAWSTCSG